LENHGGITSSAKNVVRIAKEVGSEWFGINLDLGNYHGNIYDEIAKTAPYAVNVHAKVFEDQKALKRLDFGRVRKILESAGYNGFVSLEYEGPEDPNVAVPKETKFLLEAFRYALSLESTPCKCRLAVSTQGCCRPWLRKPRLQKNWVRTESGASS